MQLHRARDEIEAGGGHIYLIGQATPRHAAFFRRKFEVDLPVLADEHRESYKAAGAKVATINELVGPKMVAKGMATSRKTGLTQGKTIGHPAQLGGVLVIAPDGAVTWSHMAQDASDNATPDEIAEALEAAAAQPAST